jgi:hypothetical protein
MAVVVESLVEMFGSGRSLAFGCCLRHAPGASQDARTEAVRGGAAWNGSSLEQPESGANRERMKRQGRRESREPGCRQDHERMSSPWCRDRNRELASAGTRERSRCSDEDVGWMFVSVASGTRVRPSSDGRARSCAAGIGPRSTGAWPSGRALVRSNRPRVERSLDRSSRPSGRSGRSGEAGSRTSCDALISRDERRGARIRRARDDATNRQTSRTRIDVGRAIRPSGRSPPTMIGETSCAIRSPSGLRVGSDRNQAFVATSWRTCDRQAFGSAGRANDTACRDGQASAASAGGVTVSVGDVEARANHRSGSRAARFEDSRGVSDRADQRRFRAKHEVDSKASVTVAQTLVRAADPATHEVPAHEWLPIGWSEAQERGRCGFREPRGV